MRLLCGGLANLDPIEYVDDIFKEIQHSRRYFKRLTNFNRDNF